MQLVNLHYIVTIYFQSLRGHRDLGWVHKRKSVGGLFWTKKEAKKGEYLDLGISCYKNGWMTGLPPLCPNLISTPCHHQARQGVAHIFPLSWFSHVFKYMQFI